MKEQEEFNASHILVETENEAREPTILANIISSQVDVHKEFGGVVPELAARSHVEKIDWITEKAIKDSGSKTFDPGLSMIRMPIKPTKIADHLLQPTFSFKINTERAATINGQLAKIACVSISPILRKR